MKFAMMAALAAAAVADTLPAWLYPTPSGPARWETADEQIVSLPGSALKLPASETRRGASAVDWFPDSHGVPPPIVLKASQPDGFACGYCHLPGGEGRPENASLAGLPVDYISEQMAAFRSGQRRALNNDWYPTKLMHQVAMAATPEEIEAAAGYFSRQRFQGLVKVVESATVPATRPLGYILSVVPGAAEPIAGRIIEVPDDPAAFELRDPNSRFTAFVPPGSIAKGRAIANGIGCMGCHGSHGGWGPGRSPSYILRQLLAFKARARANEEAEQMWGVSDQLSQDQMVAVAAWMADGARP